jgi:hypothetical protein
MSPDGSVSDKFLKIGHAHATRFKNFFALRKDEGRNILLFFNSLTSRFAAGSGGGKRFKERSFFETDGRRTSPLRRI